MEHTTYKILNAISFSYKISIFIFFFNLFLAILSLPCCAGLSLVGASWGCSLVAVHRLLTATASLVAEHGP